MAVQVGDKVRYAPHECHRMEKSIHGDHLFYFHHEDDVPGRHKKGDVVDMANAGLLQTIGGKLHTGSGHPIRVGKHKQTWPAHVVAINDDGTADLKIVHPISFVHEDHVKPEGMYWTLNYRSVPHDPAGQASNSWHAEGEGNGV